MTVEQLLKSRCKVVIDYPNNPFKIGDILTSFKANNGDIDEFFYHHKESGKNYQDTWFNTYSHIFKKLEWWEEREIEDMPEYIRLNEIMVVKVKQHFTFFAMGRPSFETEEGLVYPYNVVSTPATEEEYNKQQMK